MLISDIRPNDKNPRKIRDDQLLKLAKSISSFEKMMALRPIVVDEQGVILGGNMRYRALKHLKYTEIPNEWVKVASGLTEDERRRFIIEDNVGFGEWDFDMLRDDWDISELSEWGLEVPEFQEMKADAEEDDYDIPNEIQTDIVLGDLIEIGEHRLLCGDSTDSDAVARLMNGEKADFCFTSPPYNAAMSCAQMHSKAPKSGKGGLYVGGYADNLNSADYINFNHSVINNLLLYSKDNCTICYNINYNKNSPCEYIDIVSLVNKSINLVETIVWEKAMAVSLQGNNLTRIYEFIFVFSRGEFVVNKRQTECLKNLWKISNIGANDKNHKACFPVELASDGIKWFCVADGIIIEPFAGSGTTMVAAHQLKRKCYGMELDPKYCQVIVDRMRKLDPSLEVKRNGEKYEI